ncbi:MAG TPA: F0F1 ATP synthase subunit A [Candidatus Polarisedimenticolia bacterium]|nr:F0F1 ATP synthase subunit A [Candidatus Polarisedimenticolia bacterium]
MAEEAPHPAGQAGHAAEAAEHGAGHGDDIGSTILHHITDSRTLELGPWEIPLPEIHVGGLDLSITKHVVMMWVASLILIVLFTVFFRGRRLVPRGLANLLEMLVVFVRDEIAIKNIGEHHGRRIAPFILTVFFFILACNLLGLVPFGSTATGNVNVTAGLALMSFLVTQVEGIREHGFFKHWKNLVPHGLPVFVLPIMIVVEVLGLFVRPFALCVRLFANMTAGHVAILAFLGMIFIFESVAVSVVAVPLALSITLLEIFVAFLQAYIFAMLTSLFIGFSVHPAH